MSHAAGGCQLSSRSSPAQRKQNRGGEGIYDVIRLKTDVNNKRVTKHVVERVNHRWGLGMQAAIRMKLLNLVAGHWEPNTTVP